MFYWVNVLLFLEFINLESISYYTFIEFIRLLYTFIVISFAQYKECSIWSTPFSKFSETLAILLVHVLITIFEWFV